MEHRSPDTDDRESRYSERVNLGGIDLNLMLALDALLDQRSVTRAAGKLGLSQPTLSEALARLRRHFGDELLVRDGRGYQLTPLAVRLRERARIAVADADRLFASSRAHDPAASAREFTVCTSDYAIAVLGGQAVTILAAEAPRARLRFTGLAPVEPLEQTLPVNDLVIMPHGFLTDMPHHDLYRDTWVILASRDHPDIDGTVTAQQLRELPWVLTFHGPGAATHAVRQLRQSGIEPRPQVVADSFLALPMLIAGTRRITVIQRRLLDLLPGGAAVRPLPSPVPIGHLLEAMWWHHAYTDDPEHTYLRGVLRRAAATLPAPAPGE